MTTAELNTVQRLGDRNESGELTFQTYDLSHVTMDTARGITKDQNDNVIRELSDPTEIVNAMSSGEGEGESDGRLRTVFSMDSTTSEDERRNPKSPKDMADDTARLFRRSEISLREKAEREAAAEAARVEASHVAELERERKEREEMEREAGVDRLSQSDRRGMSRKLSKRISSSGRRAVRGISRKLSSFSEANGSSSSEHVGFRGSGSYNKQASSSGSRMGGLSKRSSMQALEIDRARDLVDESDHESDEGSVSDSEGGDGEVSRLLLYVYLVFMCSISMAINLNNFMFLPICYTTGGQEEEAKERLPLRNGRVRHPKRSHERRRQTSSR